MGLWIDPTRTKRYVPKGEEDKPADQQAAFTLRMLTAAEFARFRDASVDDKGRTRVFTFDVELLKVALAGWEGPEAPPFPEDPSEAVTRLSPALRDELSLAAWRMNTLTEDDRKN